MSSMQTAYPPESAYPAVPHFTGSEAMAAAVAARGKHQRRDNEEVLDLRTTTGGVTRLMTACQEGHERTVRQILHMKPGMVHERDRSGKTALHYCTDNPTLACIDQVVAADQTLLTARAEDGHTPLHLATIAGNRVVAKYLLTRGADINALDDEKHTAIHWATVCGEEQLLEMLIEAGGSASTPDIHGAYPLHYAAQMCGPNGEPGQDVNTGLKLVKLLVSHGAPVDVRDKDGREPMLWAASSGSADAIMLLCKAGASVVSADKDGLTALHCAASRGHLDCIDMLITLCNSETDQQDTNGCSPLFYSVTLGHADCTQLLLNNGAEADRQDRKGRTPAHCGAAKGQLETLKLLHQHGADLWKRNIKGDLPLHEACQSGRKDLVVWLLNMMPRHVNASNGDGRTPLHIAAITNNTGLCKILMDNESDVNPIMRNSRGQLLTPVDAAVARGHKGCAQYLQLHGATSAAKLTDKRALQLALSKAMLSDDSRDHTGATPNSEMGYTDILIPPVSAKSRDIDGSSQTDFRDHHQDTQDTQESGYSGSHQGDSDMASDEDETRLTKSSRERKRRIRRERQQGKERDTKSDDDDSAFDERNKNVKKGGRFNEDGDENTVDESYNSEIYEDMESLPQHLKSRRQTATTRPPRPLSGGPDKVNKLDDNISTTKNSKNHPTEMSITQAMQTTMRKYTLERRLFQQLLELKRQQIRNTKVNETVLIKRMADANNRDGALLGLRGYGGPMNFPSYEKYLYDQLRFLQSTQVEKVPQFKPMDDVEKLNRVLQRSDITATKRGAGAARRGFTAPDEDDDQVPDDPRQCYHRTHRCHHAAHAYTGIPCAAYLAPKGKKFKDKKGNNTDGTLSLPRINGANSSSNPPTFRDRNNSKRGTTIKEDQTAEDSSSAPSTMGVHSYDPKKPLTVELQPSSPPKGGEEPTTTGSTSKPSSQTQSATLSSRSKSQLHDEDVTTDSNNEKPSTS